MFTPETFLDNRLAGFGIATINGYHAAKPRLFQDLMDKPRAGGVMNDPRWWALLDIRFLVLGQPLAPQQTPAFLKPVFQGASGTVYENLLALPRATVIGAYGIVPDTGYAAIDSVSAGVHDASAFTWLTKSPGVTLGSVEGANATITKYGLHDVAIAVKTPGNALLRLADLYYVDWKVTVDGKPAEMLRADHALRAVVVPAGEHKVEFHFASPSVRTGMTLTIVSVAASLLLLFAGLYNDRRRTPTGSAGGAAAAAAAQAPGVM